MPEAWPHVSGRLEGGAHILPVRVYYEDTDLSGVVYHSNYIKYCERGRTDWLRLLGIHHTDMLGKYFFVVRRLECEYFKPAKIDDLLEVHTRFRRRHRRSHASHPAHPAGWRVAVRGKGHAGAD